jgi:regulatory protein
MGIDVDIAAEALGQITAVDDMAAARALVARRLRAGADVDRERQIRRLVGMLARKGYSSGVAMSVVLEALDGLGRD